MDDFSAFRDDRKLTYLNADGADKPLKSPLPDDVMDRARAYRLSRLRAELTRQDIAGLLMYDPINIRYAFDSVNMGVWTAHNPLRYGLVLNDGPERLDTFPWEV